MQTSCQVEPTERKEKGKQLEKCTADRPENKTELMVCDNFRGLDHSQKKCDWFSEHLLTNPFHKTKLIQLAKKAHLAFIEIVSASFTEDTEGSHIHSSEWVCVCFWLIYVICTNHETCFLP